MLLAKNTKANHAYDGAGKQNCGCVSSGYTPWNTHNWLLSWQIKNPITLGSGDSTYRLIPIAGICANATGVAYWMPFTDGQNG